MVSPVYDVRPAHASPAELSSTPRALNSINAHRSSAMWPAVPITPMWAACRRARCRWRAELYQEGLIIPPVLLQRAGQLDEGVLDLITRNSRTPEERLGDLSAQIAASRWGGAAARAGGALWPGVLAAYMGHLQDYAEAPGARPHPPHAAGPLQLPRPAWTTTGWHGGYPDRGDDRGGRRRAAGRLHRHGRRRRSAGSMPWPRSRCPPCSTWCAACWPTTRRRPTPASSGRCA